MFHVEQSALFFAAAALVAAADVTPQSPAPARSEYTLQLPLATMNDEAQRSMQAGMLDLLLGWEESARLHFNRAVAADDMCSLAYVGQLMTEPDPARRAESLAALTERINSLPSTPVETFYLATFLKLLTNDKLGAAEDFCRRAEQYRRDTLSACWGALLLHCVDVGYELDGRVRPLQERALKLAEQLYAEYPDDALVCFVRAYAEESAPQISEQALAAAKRAAELLPGHPIPSHLLGHLLYRSGKPAESVPHFMNAARCATRKDIPEWESSALMAARLYVSTAMWSAGMDGKALATRRALTAMPLDRDHLHEPAVILQRWEARTLPLRVLIKRPVPAREGVITAAAKAAEVSPALPGNDPVLLVRDCLRAALYARLRADRKHTEYALKSLKLAEEALLKFQRTREDVLAQGAHYITPWVRAMEACEIALATARAEVYTASADVWLENARNSVRPVTLMLPPVIPERMEKASKER